MDSPSPVEKLPAVHAWHTVAFCRLEKNPARQTWQTVVPVTGLYLPGPQFSHSLFLSYVPCWHGRHADNDGAASTQLDVPTGHEMQSCTEPVYSLSRYVWSGQLEQLLDPVGAYVPSEQAWH